MKFMMIATLVSLGCATAAPVERDILAGLGNARYFVSFEKGCAPDTMCQADFLIARVPAGEDKEFAYRCGGLVRSLTDGVIYSPKCGPARPEPKPEAALPEPGNE